MASIEDFVAGPLCGNASAISRARNRYAEKHSSGEFRRDVGAGSKTRDYVLSRKSPLFDYQWEVAETVRIQWANVGNRVMASLPTGGGKTRVGLWLVQDRLLNKGAENVLWIAPSNELVEQARRNLEISWFDSGTTFGLRIKTHNIEPVVRATDDLAGTVTFCTAQLTSTRLRRAIAYEPDLVVFDEAHQAAAKTYRETIERLDRGGSVKTLGLTATPGRTGVGETRNLTDVFEGNLAVPESLGVDPIKALQDKGVLARVQLRQIPLPKGCDAMRVTADRGDPPDEKLSLDSGRFWAVVRTACEVAQEKRCLLFGASLAHGEALAAAIETKGSKVIVISHELSHNERERRLNAFKIGVSNILINKNILSTGYDDPELADVILASPVRSPIQWEQIVGRVSRGPAVGGSAEARIWELDNHHSLHERVMAAQRFSTKWS